jgi:predicted AAA+ superfamily ATPase
LTKSYSSDIVKTPRELAIFLIKRYKSWRFVGKRIFYEKIHPFVYPEIKNLPLFSLEHILTTGLLPPFFLTSEAGTVEEDLSDYVNTYLKEEIAAEGLSRSLSGFARFLEVAALSNTGIINYTNIANDAQIPRQTVRLWFEILYDTLLAFELPVFRKTIKRKWYRTHALASFFR